MLFHIKFHPTVKPKLPYSQPNINFSVGFACLGTKVCLLVCTYVQLVFYSFQSKHGQLTYLVNKAFTQFQFSKVVIFFAQKVISQNHLVSFRCIIVQSYDSSVLCNSDLLPIYTRHYNPWFIFYHIFHCGLYCRAVSVTDNLYNKICSL